MILVEGMLSSLMVTYYTIHLVVSFQITLLFMNTHTQFNKLEGRSVRPVDADRFGAMLSDAVAQHSENFDVYKAFSPITFRDQSAGGSGLSFHVGSSKFGLIFEHITILAEVRITGLKP